MADENKDQSPAEKAPDAKPATKKSAKTAPAGGKIAAILIRSTVRAPTTVMDALNRLKLYKKNNCVVLDNTPVNRGMIQKVKDYVTYGEVSTETVKVLVQKRAKGKEGNVFGLNPPKGGFERKGIKRNFNVGGALGYRRDKINQLIEKML